MSVYICMYIFSRVNKHKIEVIEFLIFQFFFSEMLKTFRFENHFLNVFIFCIRAFVKRRRFQIFPNSEETNISSLDKRKVVFLISYFSYNLKPRLTKGEGAK